MINLLHLNKLIKFIIFTNIFILSFNLSYSAEDIWKNSETVNEQEDDIESQNNIVDNESFRPDIPIFTWDFEDETNLWANDEGWELTETSYNSETHSYLSPNTAATYNNTWDVISPQVTLPEVGDGEVLRFNFWINGSTPDTDGNGDNYLEDYYQF